MCGAPRGQAHNYLTAFRTLDYALCLWMYRKGQDTLGVITVAPGCASTYRSSILGSLDWDGGTLVEDMDLTVQIHRKRLGRIRYAEDAVVYTQDPRRIREYIGQLTRWYSGTWQVMRFIGCLSGASGSTQSSRCSSEKASSTRCWCSPCPCWHGCGRLATLRWLLLDQSVFALAAVACAWRLRRFDVLLWFPTFATAPRDRLRRLGSHVLAGSRPSAYAANVVLGRALRLQCSIALQHREVPCLDSC